MSIYDRVKEIGKNTKIFYHSTSISNNLIHFKSDFLNPGTGGENPMEIGKDSQFKFSYNQVDILKALLVGLMVLTLEI